MTGLAAPWLQDDVLGSIATVAAVAAVLLVLAAVAAVALLRTSPGPRR